MASGPIGTAISSEKDSQIRAQQELQCIEFSSRNAGLQSEIPHGDDVAVRRVQCRCVSDGFGCRLGWDHAVPYRSGWSRPRPQNLGPIVIGSADLPMSAPSATPISSQSLRLRSMAGSRPSTSSPQAMKTASQSRTNRPPFEPVAGRARTDSACWASTWIMWART